MYELIVDGKLFYCANDEVYNAKESLNVCRRIMASDVQADSEYVKNIENSINDCFTHMEQLINRVETAKENTMKTEPDFLRDYALECQKQVSEIFTPGEDGLLVEISEEDKNKYLKEHYIAQLAILEQSGKNDPETQKSIEYLKYNIEKCEINEKISDKIDIDNEYINLFTRNYEIDKELIKMNYEELSDEEIESILSEMEEQFQKAIYTLDIERDIHNLVKVQSEFDEDSPEYFRYNQMIIQRKLSEYIDIMKYRDLTPEEQQIFSQLDTEKRYEALLEERAKASGFFNTFTRWDIDKQILNFKCDNGLATQAEIEYRNMTGWQKFCNNYGVVTCSIFEAEFKAGENIVDACASTWMFFDQDNADLKNFVAKDHATSFYDDAVKSGNLSAYNAYGKLHTTSYFAGDVISTVALWNVPGAWGVSAFSTFGSSMEKNFQNGDDYYTALMKSAPRAAASYVTTKFLVGFNKYTAGNTKTIAQFFRNMSIAGGISGTGSVVDTSLEFLFSGTDQNYGEYFLSHDGFKKLGKSVVSGFISNGLAGARSLYKENKLQNGTDLEKYKYMSEKQREEFKFNKADEAARMDYEIDHGPGSYKLMNPADKFVYRQQYLDEVNNVFKIELSNTQKFISWAVHGKVFGGKKSYTNYVDGIEKAANGGHVDLKYKSSVNTAKSTVAKSVKSVIFSGSSDGLGDKYNKDRILSLIKFTPHGAIVWNVGR